MNTIQSNEKHGRWQTWNSLLLFLLLVAGFAIYQVAYAVVVPKTNGANQYVDSQLVTESVTFLSTDFEPGALVYDVDVQLKFEKPGCCGDEIVYYLTSPASTRVVLVENSDNDGGSGNAATYSGGSGSVTIDFDDSAAVAAGGNPTSGTFLPEQPLLGFQGENPAGVWTMTIGDDASADPLLHDEFTVSITPNKETQAVSGPSTLTYPTGATIEVVNDGGCLTALTVERLEQNHPNANATTMVGGYYFNITPTGCTTGFNTNLTLPHFATPDGSDKLCRFTGTSTWDCAADSFDVGAGTITRNGVTEFSAWTLANDANPTAVTVRSVSAANSSSVAFLPILMASLLLLFMGAIALRRHFR